MNLVEPIEDAGAALLPINRQRTRPDPGKRSDTVVDQDCVPRGSGRKC